jgi:hypothetical protein
MMDNDWCLHEPVTGESHGIPPFAVASGADDCKIVGRHFPQTYSSCRIQPVVIEADCIQDYA